MKAEHWREAAELEAQAPADLPQLWNAVTAARARRQRRLVQRRLALTAVLAASLGALASAWYSRIPAPNAPVVAIANPFVDLEASTRAGRPWRLPEGSVVTAEPGASLQLLRLSPDAIHLRLDSGQVSFAVVPGGPRAWTVEAGWARIQVVGTRFSVVRRPDAVEVMVESGRVRVEAEALPGGVRLLGSGEALKIAAPVSLPSVTPGPSAMAAPTASIQLPPGPDPSTRSVRAARGPSTPRALAAADPPIAAPAAPSLGVLLAAADQARRQGDNAGAAAQLREALRRYPDAPSMGMVAYRLGRLELERLDRPSAAAESFAQALALGLPKALEEDGLAALVQAYRAAQAGPQAAEAAARYLARFPAGRRAPEVRSWARGP